MIGLDLADAVFEPGTTEMRAQWRPRLDMLMKELQKAPAILRLSYLADVENEQLVQRRLEAIKSEIASRWQSLNASYQLTIEPEVFWRLGAPPQQARDDEQVTAMFKHRYLWLLIAALLALAAQAQDVVESPRGETVERNLPTDEPLRPWTHDPKLLQKESGDRVEMRPVHAERLATVKLTDVVPPIRFDSGVADIPQSYIESLRKALDDLRDRRNVRLHLVGHADDQPLSDELARIYGDNAGLSRERAGEVAEFLQTRLALPAEAISYEWVGTTKPVATQRDAGRPRPEPARRSAGLVRRDAGGAGRGRGAGQGGHQARQGLPHGDRLQDALQGRPCASHAHPQSGAAAALRGHAGGLGSVRRARQAARWRTCRTSRTSRSS